jgi:hypothetical protein
MQYHTQNRTQEKEEIISNNMYNNNNNNCNNNPLIKLSIVIAHDYITNNHMFL